MTHEPIIVFDPDKDAASQVKHGLPLSFAGAVIKGAAGTYPDPRFDYGEDRDMTGGNVDDRLQVADPRPQCP